MVTTAELLVLTFYFQPTEVIVDWQLKCQGKASNFTSADKRYLSLLLDLPADLLRSSFRMSLKVLFARDMLK